MRAERKSPTSAVKWMRREDAPGGSAPEEREEDEEGDEEHWRLVGKDRADEADVAPHGEEGAVVKCKAELGEEEAELGERGEEEQPARGAEAVEAERRRVVEGKHRRGGAEGGPAADACEDETDEG